MDLQLPMQSLPIAIYVVSFTPAYGEVYSVQHYAIKFVSDLWQVGGFLLVRGFLHQ
jgi:hypothetical protein